jgi:hypothetical protein
MKTILKALFDPAAWVLLILGGILLGARIPLPDTWLVNLPELITMLQLCGGLFLICAFCIFASRLIWPEIDVGKLMSPANTNPGAHVIIMGLLIFNGLLAVAFAIWLAWVFQGAMAVTK